MKITKHFDSTEFDCHDGTKYPQEWIETKLKTLCEQLEIIRKEFCDKKITVLSGYRTIGHNLKVGGKKASKHLEGIAVDFKVFGVPAKIVQERVKKLMVEGKIKSGAVGRYGTFTHYDTRQVAKIVDFKG